MIFAAIDPGAVHAAIAVFHDHTPVFVDDIRTVNGQLDAAALRPRAARHEGGARRRRERALHARARASPAVSNSGWACGIIHGVAGALSLPLTLVTPTQWKSLPRRPRRQGSWRGPSRSGSGPQHNRHLDRKKDADRAEALLIGDWYYVRCVIPRANRRYSHELRYLRQSLQA